MAEAELIKKTAEATSKAVADALSKLKLQPTPTVRLSKFVDRPQKPGDLTIREWLDDVETYARQLGYKDEAKLAVLTDNLGGNAKDEYLCASEETRENFDKLADLLRHRFGPAESLPSLSRTFNARSQQDGETLADYSRCLMRLHSRMEAATPDDQVKQALVRLRDLTLTGQFKKGVIDRDVSRDIERLEIREPNQPFTTLRDEILRLYQDREILRRTKVRGLEFVPEQTEPVSVAGVSGASSPGVDPNVQALIQ